MKRNLLILGTVLACFLKFTTIASADEFEWGDGIRTLIVGGGSAHDFDRWFNREDTGILSRGNLASVNYTDEVSRIKPALDEIDVLYLSNNQPMPDPALRKAIFEFADNGGSLLLVHAGLWYNWRDWPAYNRVLAGGGSRGHDRLGEFEVKLTDRKHPVTDGLPDTFSITDELYYFEADPEGTPMTVLATAHSERRGKTYPIVWIVEHPKARIVAITLGHDGQAHRNSNYQKLLRNSVRWLAGEQ